jgi:putative Mg2+ transporter-C (MgtC) family protein
MPFPLEVLVKLFAAVVFGGIVGYQREVRERPAGLRTHVLVCVGACVYTLASMGFGQYGSDPARVAAQVATGMGFLGAGTIIRHGNVVRGLTTAASLWAVAAIGLCVGLGREAYWVGVLATLVVLFTLSLLHRLEHRFGVHGIHAACTFRLPGGAQQIAAVQQALRALGIGIDSCDVSRVEPGDVLEMQLSLRLRANADLAAITGDLSQFPGFVGFQSE